MTEFINIADLPDLGDTQGRSYRQINADTAHKIKIGTLVEIENGVRLFVVKYTRDCDMTPLYSLGVENDDDNIFSQSKWIHGYCEEALKVIYS